MPSAAPKIIGVKVTKKKNQERKDSVAAELESVSGLEATGSRSLLTWAGAGPVRKSPALPLSFSNGGFPRFLGLSSSSLFLGNLETALLKRVRGRGGMKNGS